MIASWNFVGLTALFWIILASCNYAVLLPKLPARNFRYQLYCGQSIVKPFKSQMWLVRNFSLQTWYRLISDLGNSSCLAVSLDALPQWSNSCDPKTKGLRFIVYTNTSFPLFNPQPIEPPSPAHPIKCNTLLEYERVCANVSVRWNVRWTLYNYKLFSFAHTD